MAQQEQEQKQEQKQEQRHRFRASLARRMHELALAMDKSRMADYMNYLDSTRQILKKNFFSGLARGLGMAVGFSILGALVVLLLQAIAKNDLPWISDFVRSIVNTMESAPPQ